MSNGKQETIKDIVAEMRGNEFDDPHLNADGIIGARRLAKGWADRIEAAWKRERDELVYSFDPTMAGRSKSPDPSAYAIEGMKGFEERKRNKEPSVGNAAAMRAAIKKAIAMIFCTVATGGTKFKPVVDVLEAALAAPPKNCDVGTAEEQEERYNSWRNADGLRAVFGKNPLEWAQMPYAPDTKKEERNDAE